MRFAKVGEAAFKRRKELKTDKERDYQYETFLLYLLIIFHTWDDSGICKKPIREICEIWGLDYDNSMRRYKLLRVKGWCEKAKYIENTKFGKKTKFGIRPLVGMKTVDSTVESNQETVDFTVNNCKVYSENDSKTVKSTVIYKDNIEPFKEQSFSRAAAETKPAAADEINGHKSIFSIEECLKYVDLCIARGERITNPHGLAASAHKSGEMDAFISATLYPEQIETQTIEYDDEFSQAAPLDDTEFNKERELLRKAISDGLDITNWGAGYTPQDWQRLMKELENADS